MATVMKYVGYSSYPKSNIYSNTITEQSKTLATVRENSSVDCTVCTDELITERLHVGWHECT